MMDCAKCIRLFDVIGEGFNSALDTPELLDKVAYAITQQFDLHGCVFRLLSRDQKTLDDVASYGLSQRFMDKGPVEAELSIAAALEGDVVLVEDCATDPRIQYPADHVAEGIVSCLTVPLRTRGQVIGTMRLFTKESRTFNPLEIRVAEIVASFATRAITHCMFHKTLDRVTDSLRTVLDPTEVLGRIVTVISEELRAKGASVHLLDRTEERLVLRASSGISRRYADDGLGDAVRAVWPLLEDDPMVLHDPEYEDIIPDPDAVRAEGIATQLFVPLRVRRRDIGVLGVYTNLPYRFSDDELYFMNSIADQCALAIENARMYTALEDQYQKLVNDFQLWFERPYPGVGSS